MPALPRLVSAVVLLLPVCLLTGCVTRGYKLAPESTPPAVTLNLPSTPPASDASPSIEAVVKAVIVYKGPGSWKKEACWDEYVVTVSNRGGDPLVLTDASLHPNEGEPTKPGDNPWQLEKIGRSWWKTNAGRQTGTYLLLGGGSVLALASPPSALGAHGRRWVQPRLARAAALRRCLRCPSPPWERWR